MAECNVCGVELTDGNMCCGVYWNEDKGGGIREGTCRDCCVPPRLAFKSDGVGGYERIDI